MVFERYYQVVEEGKELANGNILKLAGKLEVVAGEQNDKEGHSLLDKMEISHNATELLGMGAGFRFYELEEDRAKLMIKDWGDYVESVMYAHPVTGKNCQPETPWRDM
jgi:hypothetical protein